VKSLTQTSPALALCLTRSTCNIIYSRIPRIRSQPCQPCSASSSEYLKMSCCHTYRQ